MARAGVTQTARYTSADALACVHGGTCDNPAEKIDETNSFAPVDLPLSAAMQATGSSASASGNVHSEVQQLSNGVRFTGRATANGFASGGNPNAGVQDASTGEGEGRVSYNFSVSGETHQLKVVGNVKTTARTTAFNLAQIYITHTNGAFDATVSGTGSKPIDEVFVLAPGDYRIVAVLHTYAQTGRQTTDPQSDSTSASFEFNADVTTGNPTPTPTPTPNEVKWKSAVSGSFGTATNWNPERVPLATDTAVFDLPGTYTVSMSQNFTNKRLRANGNGVNVTLDLGGNVYSINEARSGGADSDNVSLTFRGGGGPTAQSWVKASSASAETTSTGEVRQAILPVNKNSHQSYIGGALVSAAVANVDGQLEISGVGSKLDASDLNIGVTAGSGGTFDLSDGASASTTNARVGLLAGGISSPAAHGVARVKGGAAWHLSGNFIVGQAGTGNVFVTSGSKVDWTLPATIGEGAGSNGTITVSGASSLLHGDDIVVGKKGAGTLAVQAAGFANVKQLQLAKDPGSSGQLIVSNKFSSLSAETLEVANGVGSGSGSVTGSFTLQDQATAAVRELRIATSNGGNGTVTISNLGSLAVKNQLQIGRFAILSGQSTGKFSVLSGGSVLQNTGSSTTIGDNGTLLVSAGVCDVGNVTVDSGGLLRADSGGVVQSDRLAVNGMLQILSGGIINIGFGDGIADKLRIGPGGILSGTGTITASEIVAAGSGANQFAGAQIQPANSPGTLTLDGNFIEQAGSRLVVEAAGLGAGQFDVLHVTGNATLAGTLEVHLLNGYLPKSGDTMPFMQVDGTVSGSFANITFPDLLPGFQYKAAFVNSTFKLTALNDAVLAPTQLLNISTRMQVGTADDVLIGGFILTGNEPKRVMIRAIGPSLSTSGVAGALADPNLELHDSKGALIAKNDNWATTQKGGVIKEDQSAEIQGSGIVPSAPEESAIITTLTPGAYTAIVRGANNSTGVGLAEVYDLSGAVPSKLANISTRGLVETGENVMIGGFIVGNTSTKVLVRALGPSLPVAGKLVDPFLELHNANGAVLQSNDNWKTNQKAEIEATTIPPGNELESAIVRTLTPGNYTAVVRGVNDTTGVALVELYALN